MEIWPVTPGSREIDLTTNTGLFLSHVNIKVNWHQHPHHKPRTQEATLR